MSEFRSLKHVIAHLDTATTTPWFDEAAAKELIEYCLSTYLGPTLEEYEGAFQRAEVAGAMPSENFPHVAARLHVVREAPFLIEGLIPVLSKSIVENDDFAARGMVATIMRANKAVMAMTYAADEEPAEQLQGSIEEASGDLLLSMPELDGSGEL